MLCRVCDARVSWACAALNRPGESEPPETSETLRKGEGRCGISPDKPDRQRT